MAGSGQKKAARRQDERIVPSLKQGGSRVSKAASVQGSGNAQRIDQRSNGPASRQAARTPVSSKSSPRANQSAGANKKSPPLNAQRPRPSAATIPPSGYARGSSDVKDVQILQWLRSKWDNLEPHHQQRVFGSILLLLSLLLFASLTIFHAAPVWQAFNAFFLLFFGWTAYLLSLGLIAFSVAHLIEGFRKIQILRWTFVLGLLAIWLLLLIESRLIMGPDKVGLLAEVLAVPLLGWPVAVRHIIIIGLLLIVVIVTFRITFRHVLLVAHFVQKLLSDRQIASFSKRSAINEEDEYDQANEDDDDISDDPARYLGQRPQYSRYAGVVPQPDRQSGSALASRLARGGRRLIAEEEEEEPEEQDDDRNIAFEADFPTDEDSLDDPRNDVNFYQPQIGRVQRGARTPRQFNPDEHAQAVQGARQQALPLELPETPHQPKVILKQSPLDMEPLAPNPTMIKPPKKARASVAAPNIVSSWKLPDITLFNNPDETKLHIYGDDTSSLAKTIQDTLRSFRVDAEVKEEDISIGPTIIRFGIRPTGKPEMKKDEKTGKMVPVRDAAGQIVYESRTRVSRIMALQNDLALVLEAKTIRMEAPVPGRPYVGVEVPNKNSRLVTLREVLESKEYLLAKTKSKLSIGLGKDVAGQVRVGDLARMPHLLIAGATGAGKSVCINTIIASILTQATPDDVRLLMVDPKMVELNMYNGIPHLLSPVVIEVDKVVSLLKNAISEMERRYRQFSQLGVRNLDGYRKLRLEKFAQGDTSLNNLPAIVIIIDELADLMMAAPEEVEGMICRLAQLARATGIHLVVATQRPSVDVITGLIKANIPTRISFMVSSAVDSRTIIDMGGAERLLGRGDMLYLPADAGKPERIQGAFLTDDEAQLLADYWRQQVIEHAALVDNTEVADVAQPLVEPGWEVREEPADEFELEDDLLDKAEEIVRDYGRASISLLQRRLRIGYSRAARLIDLLEQHGVIGQSEAGGRAREVYDQSNAGYGRQHEASHSVADEVADIVAEEKSRDEFLRNQAARFQSQNGHNPSVQDYDEEEEDG